MCFAYWERRRSLRARIPSVYLCAGHLWLGPDNWSGCSTGKGTLSIPSTSPLEESSDATWYSSSSLQKTFTQQKQMLGPQPAVASQSCLEESGIQFKIQFSLKQLTWLARISPDWPGEATVPSSKTGKLITAVEALVGKLSPVQPWNKCLFHSFRHTSCPMLSVNSTWRLQG